ncbi:MAG: glycosyltransferase, partial [Clostridia bacterium]|nr:glycosyltransferase [Clostridia bacterium]
VLIVAKYWDASAGIAALRPMKIAKYLLRAGHRVAVLCGHEYAALADPCPDLRALRSDPGYTEIPAFSYSSVFKKEDAIYQKRNAAPKAAPPAGSSGMAPAPKKQSLPNRLKWRLYKTVYNSLKVRNTVRLSLKAYNKTGWKPDVILSSYAPEEVHFLAARIKKQVPSAFWIADFRDPMANSTNQKPYEYRYRLKREKRILRMADATTVVSRTWRDEFRDLGGKNVYTVRSGFDRDDFADRTDAAPAQDKLTLTYTGSLYAGLSDLRPLFSAFAELISQGLVDPNRLRFVYAGAHGGEFARQAAVLPPEVEIVDHGFVPRADSLRLLKESDLLLHALFCTPGLRGIITGKLGEYWLSGKPIVAIVTGSVRADEFISILERSRTGFAYDGTDEAASFERLKACLLDAYDQKKNGKPIPYDRDEAYISKFDYRVIAERLIGIAQGETPQDE